MTTNTKAEVILNSCNCISVDCISVSIFINKHFIFDLC